MTEDAMEDAMHEQGQEIYDLLKARGDMTTGQISRAMDKDPKIVIAVLKNYEGISWKRVSKVHPYYKTWLSYWQLL